MTRLDALPEIVSWMRNRGISELEWTEGGTTLGLSLQAQETSTPTGNTPPPRTEQSILSPEMGIFRYEGQRETRPVRRGDIIGFVEVGPLRVPVACPDDGVLLPPIEQDGALVGYSTPLFKIDTTPH